MPDRRFLSLESFQLPPQVRTKELPDGNFAFWHDFESDEKKDSQKSDFSQLSRIGPLV